MPRTKHAFPPSTRRHPSFHRHACRRLVATCLLLLFFAPPPGMTVPHAETSRFVDAMHESQTRYETGDWRGAAATLRKAYGATNNMFEREIAGHRLAGLQASRGHYAAASKTLESMIPLEECFHDRLEMQQLQTQTASLAWRAGDKRRAYGLLRQIPHSSIQGDVSWGHNDARNWVIGTDEAVLHDRLAGMSFPAVTQFLIRSTHHSAGAPGELATVNYQALPGPKSLHDIRVSVDIVAHENHDKPISSELHRVAAGQPWKLGPDFAIAGAEHAKQAHREKLANGGWRIRAEWVARIAPWDVYLTASWNEDEDSAAQKAMTQLLGAIDWRPADALFRGRSTATANLDTAIALALRNDDWGRAGQLATERQNAAPPLFPTLKARLLSAKALATAQARQYDRALPLFQQAFAAWRYSPLGYNDESLFSTLLLHAADTAYRNGDTELGRQWLGFHLKDQSLLQDWSWEDSSKVIRYRPMNFGLHLRIDDFLLNDVEGNLAYYRNVATDQVIGITLLKSSPGKMRPVTPDLLRNWMISKRGLQVGKFESTAFGPASHGDSTGTAIVFHVRHLQPRNVVFIDGKAPPAGARMMGFWVSEVGRNAVILRSEWPAGDKRARALVQSMAGDFPWPRSSSALQPMARPRTPDIDYCVANSPPLPENVDGL